jgi:hypothetical protein
LTKQDEPTDKNAEYPGLRPAQNLAGQSHARWLMKWGRGTLLVIFLLTLIATMIHFAHATFSQT